jgi:hypothetical protein
MNKVDPENNDIERLLRKVRPAEPSAELKARITGAAQEAWKEAPAETPWRIGLRRLALSAAAAILIVYGADSFSTRSVARWQAGPLIAAQMTPADLEDVPEAPYGPFVRHLMAIRQSSGRDPVTLLHYLERMQESLRGLEQDDAPDGPDATERRSRLVPVPSDIGWHV